MDRQLRSSGIKKAPKPEKPKKAAKARQLREAAAHVEVEDSDAKPEKKMEGVQPEASKKASRNHGYYGAIQARREIPPWLCKKAKTPAKIPAKTPAKPTSRH